MTLGKGLQLIDCQPQISTKMSREQAGATPDWGSPTGNQQEESHRKSAFCSLSQCPVPGDLQAQDRRKTLFLSTTCCEID